MKLIKYDFQGEQHVKRFLNKVSKEFVEEVESYFDDTGENPFDFREKTFTSILFPVLQRSCKRVTMELNYKTKNREKENYLDFHCLDKRNGEERQYLIEFKHTWGKGITKKNQDKWNEVNAQIKKINKDNLGKELFNLGETYQISLMLYVLNKWNKETIEDFDPAIEGNFPDYNYRYDWEIPEEVNDKFEKKRSTEDFLETIKVALLGTIKEL